MASGFIIALARKKPGAGRMGADSRQGEGDMPGPDPDSSAGGSYDDGTSRDDLAKEPRDKYSDVVDSCISDLADVLKVDDSDKDKFGSAMEDLIEAISKRADETA